MSVFRARYCDGFFVDLKSCVAFIYGLCGQYSSLLLELFCSCGSFDALHASWFSLQLQSLAQAHTVLTIEFKQVSQVLK